MRYDIELLVHVHVSGIFPRQIGLGNAAAKIAKTGNNRKILGKTGRNMTIYSSLYISAFLRNLY